MKLFVNNRVESYSSHNLGYLSWFLVLNIKKMQNPSLSFCPIECDSLPVVGKDSTAELFKQIQ
jgi:hypothetical protein